MASLRPRRHFDFVRLWKFGFIFSSILIVLSISGLITSFVLTGSPLTLGTEFSGGTSIQINNVGNITESQLTSAYNAAASSAKVDATISSVQTTNSNGSQGYLIKTTNTNSKGESTIMSTVESKLGISASNVQVETIGASWGASVIGSSLLAFLLSCVAILIVIAARYRDPRMGVVALVTLFHDLVIVIGVYAWSGIFFHMEVTSDVIAALLAIVGYSLYDTIVVFHRINANASPQMHCSMRTCANRSINEVIMRSLNTSMTSILPILLMLILGTDTLHVFAFAMFVGMLCGVYSTLAISAPLYTLWKTREPKFAQLEKKYPYEVIQSPFTKEMNKEAKAADKIAHKEEKEQRAQQKAERKKEKAELLAQSKRQAKSDAVLGKSKQDDTVDEGLADAEPASSDGQEPVSAEGDA